MGALFSFDALLGLSTLTLMEIVLGIDNVVFIAILVAKLPAAQQNLTAMVLAMLVMLVSAGVVTGFVDRHPSVKILALSFLLLIGVMLVAEGMGTHMAKGYVYFAMAFSLFVEMLNLRYRQRDVARRPARA